MYCPNRGVSIDFIPKNIFEDIQSSHQSKVIIWNKWNANSVRDQFFVRRNVVLY